MRVCGGAFTAKGELGRVTGAVDVIYSQGQVFSLCHLSILGAQCHIGLPVGNVSWYINPHP